MERPLVEGWSDQMRGHNAHTNHINYGKTGQTKSVAITCICLQTPVYTDSVFSYY